MVGTWYCIVSLMLIAYIALDGRNFGVGVLHYIVARTPEERRHVIAALGPLWSWHEVWLVAFGGTLLLAFPRLMASAFSGYYLALFLILWCFILRGVSIELGGHIDSPLWQSFWDFVFVVSNILLAALFGVAAGNLIRGVPLDPNGSFSLAFFTDFRVRGNVGLLDWYTVSIAAFTVVLLAAHGATYLMLKTEGAVQDRSAALAKLLWAAAAPLFLVVSIETWLVRPDLFAHPIHYLICWLGLLLLFASIVPLISGLSNRMEKRAFVASNLVLGSLIATGAASMFPVMLHSTLQPENSLTAYSVAASRGTLVIGFAWWPIGLALTIIYAVFISRRYSGRVSAHIRKPTPEPTN
jgi:cytochrome bd ubiquinol oxidase subunit II